MIRLHPLPDVDHACPHCHVPLEVAGWYIPGMRMLADLRCEQCGKEFYGDLASGHGIHMASLVEKETGVVHAPYNTWFATWLAQMYRKRTTTPVQLTVQEYRPLCRQVVLLNCLDRVYGHSLLKLLNAEYYLAHRRDLDLVLMIPRCLGWMVPDGAEQVWIVEQSLDRSEEWNDSLAAEIDSRLRPLEVCWLSVAFPHPHPNTYTIQRFTRVPPFPLDEWETRLDKPVITFIWREDKKRRMWSALDARVDGRLPRTMRSTFKQCLIRSSPLRQQTERLLSLATTLRQQLTSLDFGIAGVGEPGGMPGWVTDLRTTQISESTERKWAQRYASSHIVVGVHGSGMLLPTAHAGAAVELVPPGKWVNMMDATLFRRGDAREIVYRYRYYPLNTAADDLAWAIIQQLNAHREMTRWMPLTACDHSLLPANKRMAIRS